MQYKVIERVSLDALEITISRYLKEGWELAGGVAILLSNGLVLRAQALTKE